MGNGEVWAAPGSPGRPRLAKLRQREESAVIRSPPIQSDGLLDERLLGSTDPLYERPVLELRRTIQLFVASGRERDYAVS